MYHFIRSSLRERGNSDLYARDTFLQNTRTSAKCCFGYESSKQDLLVSENRPQSTPCAVRIRRKAQRDRAGSRLRHPVCRGTKSMHLARSIGPIPESCLLLTQATLFLSSSFFVSFFFSFPFFLPGPTREKRCSMGDKRPTVKPLETYIMRMLQDAAQM